MPAGALNGAVDGDSDGTTDGIIGETGDGVGSNGFTLSIWTQSTQRVYEKMSTNQ